MSLYKWWSKLIAAYSGSGLSYVPCIESGRQRRRAAKRHKHGDS
ncbi:MAG: hypothetical protein WC473_04850 [Patescibacteria group bacterium]